MKNLLFKSIIVVCAILLGGCSENDSSVEVIEVENNDKNIYGEYDAWIAPYYSVEVRARVEGYLEKVCFNDGAFVKKGQLLFKIDPTIYKARVKKAEAQLKKAEADASKAEKNLNRIKPLFELKAASLADLDNATAVYEQALAEVSICEADLLQAKNTLEYTELRAPMSGYISETEIDEGTFVGADGKSLLATILRTDSVSIYFGITDNDYLRIKSTDVRLGDEDTDNHSLDSYITLTLANGEEYPHLGIIDFTAPQIDRETGKFIIRAEVINNERTLIPWQRIKVKLRLTEEINSTIIPKECVMDADEEPYVHIVRNDSLLKHDIKVICIKNGNAVIGEGLAKGDLVVTKMDSTHEVGEIVEVKLRK